MNDIQPLVYFFGDWPREERAVVAEAAQEVTPEEVRHAWNAKLGHLWVVLRHGGGRVSAQMGVERVEAGSVDALAAQIRRHAWDHANDAWASRRGDGRLRV